MAFRFKLCLAAAAFLLSSCEHDSPPPESTAVQRLVGGTAPTETVHQQEARFRGILRRSDSFNLSRISFHASNAASPELITNPPECSGTRCTYYAYGQARTLDLNSVSVLTGATILSRNGVTIEQYWTDNTAGFSSVLHNSGFGSSWAKSSSGTTSRSSLSYGDATGSRPPLRGTWSGMMTGVLSQNDDLLLGDAVLQYEISGDAGTLHAEFRNIANVSRNQAHSVRNIWFYNLPVSSGGTFGRRDSASRIQGGFYGSGHSEASGVFEHSGILGSFGANKQQRAAAQPHVPGL